MTKEKPDVAKIPAELFHSYLVDSRDGIVNKSKTTSFITNEYSRIHFFSSDLEDPTRTNSDSACCISGDDSFLITSIRIGVKLSNREHLPDFLRATRFSLIIGEKPYCPIEANLLADSDATHGVSFRQEPVEPREFQVDLWAEKQLEMHISIPPRQSFSVVMDTYNVFSDRMRALEEGKVKEFAEIRVTLCGKRITHNPATIGRFLGEFGQDVEGPEKPVEENTQNSPYRGYGTPPRYEDPLDLFCTSLMRHLKTQTYDGRTWNSYRVRSALLGCMAEFPSHWNKDREFTIPLPAEETKPAPDPEAEFFAKDQKNGKG
jgi:hypothetical protein